MKKTRITRNCEKCNGIFEAHLYSIRNGHGRFCSRKCKGKIGGQKRLGEERKCFICSESFYAAKWEDKKGLKKYCSPKCVNKSRIGSIPPNKGIPMSEEQKKKVSESRRGLNIGAANPSWRGGVTPTNKKIRESIEYRLWREAVFARDNYSCQSCSKRGGVLHADHINPFSLFPELRFAIDNGQTLCVSCHREKTKKDLVVIKSLQYLKTL